MAGGSRLSKTSTNRRWAICRRAYLASGLAVPKTPGVTSPRCREGPGKVAVNSNGYFLVPLPGGSYWDSTRPDPFGTSSTSILRRAAIHYLPFSIYYPYMKAIQVAKVGGPEALTLVDLPVADPKPTEALVQIKAAGV